MIREIRIVTNDPDLSVRSFDLFKSRLETCSFTHADGCRRGDVEFLPLFVCMSVCFFSHDISRPMQLGSPNLVIEMFHRESWKPIYFGVKRSKVKITSHKSIAGVGVCTLVSAGFF